VILSMRPKEACEGPFSRFEAKDLFYRLKHFIKATSSYFCLEREGRILSCARYLAMVRRLTEMPPSLRERAIFRSVNGVSPSRFSIRPLILALMALDE